MVPRILGTCETDDVSEAQKHVDPEWYRRFRLPEDQIDAAAKQPKIARAAKKEATSPRRSTSLELAWVLTPLGEEREAARCGRRAMELARSRGSVAIEIEALLHTATALQYSNRQVEAEAMFENGIELCRMSGPTRAAALLPPSPRTTQGRTTRRGERDRKVRRGDHQREHRLDHLAESSRMALAGLRPLDRESPAHPITARLCGWAILAWRSRSSRLLSWGLQLVGAECSS